MTDQNLRNFDLEGYAADLRRNTGDARQQATQLAETLERLLPDQTSRELQGGWPFGKPRLAQLRVHCGDTVYQLRCEGQQVHWQQVHHVAGIDLHHADVSQDTWLHGLAAALREQHGTRTALPVPESPEALPHHAELGPWVADLHALIHAYARGGTTPGTRTLAFRDVLTQARELLNLPTLTPERPLDADLQDVLNRARDAARQEFEAHTAGRRADLLKSAQGAADTPDRSSF